MANTTRTQIPAEVNNFYDRKLLTRAVPLFVHTRWAQIRDIPRNAGTSLIKFRRYGNLTAATTALTEGVTPAGSQLSVTDITATALQYGDFVTVTDVVDYESQDPVLSEATEILGDQYGDTVDQLCRDVIVAGTTVQRVNDRATRLLVQAGDKADAATFRKCIKTLKNAEARQMTTQVDPNTGYNTTPIPKSYIGIIHPDISYTVKHLTGFVPVEKYPNGKTVMEGEIGYFEEVRLIETTNAKVHTGEGAAAIDVYSIIILGMNAYGTTRISGEAVKNIVKPLGSGGTQDPLDQRATSGWKATFIAKILNDDFMIRLECSAS